MIDHLILLVGHKGALSYLIIAPTLATWGLSTSYFFRHYLLSEVTNDTH
jgi:hypothetical protein